MKCIKHPKQNPHKKPKYLCDTCLTNYDILVLKKPRFLKVGKIIKDKRFKQKYKEDYSGE